jgi:DNA mismatch repair protein MutS2
VPGTNPFVDAIEKLDFNLVREEIKSFSASLYGKERIEQLTPLVIFAEVQDELQRVSEMIALIQKDDLPPIHGLPDCRAALHRANIDASIITGEDFRDILMVLRVSRELKLFLEKRDQSLLLLSSFAEQLAEDKLLEYHIDRVVDDEGNVKDSASKDLRRIRKEIMDHSSALRRKMDSILKRVTEDQIVQEELVTLRDGRLVLPVKAEYKKQVSGFIHSSSASGQTVYIEPMEALELNNDIRDLQFEEQRELARILEELTKRLRSTLPDLHEALAVYAELDSLYARAKYGNKVQATIPVLQLERRMMIQQGRHPILLQHKKFSDVIPMDINLGDPEKTIVITGPNAGGKSVAMKSVGLFALMTQCGIPIPCAEPTLLPVYEDILVDIGDEQSVENDLSTFSSHVQRLSRIVDTASAKTLVLIDEIGTGTDPSEGSALGASILEYLTRCGGHVIATTHHGMLKAVAHEHEDMLNATMEFDLDSLQPTYRFRSGIPGSSYAFEITRRHGMNPDIIERGREILDTKSNALEQLLVDVERKSQELGKRVRESEASLEKSKTLVTEYEQKLKSVKEETRGMKKQALEEASSIVNNAQALIEHTVKDLRERQASKESIKDSQEQIRQKIDALEHELKTEHDEKKPEPSMSVDFQEGDVVRMKSGSDTSGVVLTEIENGHVVVVFGSLKMRSSVKDLELIRRDEEKKERISTNIISGPEGYEIDVRGKYGDEAVREVDDFIYRAYSAGMQRIEIIHGKGTGALRTRIHNYLAESTIVKEYELASSIQGGSGMTVVTLKPD